MTDNLNTKTRSFRRAMRMLIPEKTSEWLGANDLSGQYVVGSCDKVLRVFKHVYASVENCPNYVQQRRCGKRISVCLNINYLDEFLEFLKHFENGAYALQKKKILPNKTSEWLVSEELAGQYVVGTAQKVSNVLSIVHASNSCPEYIQPKQSVNRVAICVNKKNIDEFILFLQNFKNGKYALKKKLFYPAKTSEWLRDKELMPYFVGTEQKILNVLKRVYESDKCPDYLQKRQSGTQTPLCLNKNHIDEFAKFLLHFENGAYALQKREHLPKKTPEWVTARELEEKYVLGAEKKLVALLRKVYESKDCPKYVQKIRSKSHVAICVNKNHIDEFFEVFLPKFAGYTYRLRKKEKLIMLQNILTAVANAKVR